MNSKYSGLKIRKEDIKDILCGFIFYLLILLSCAGIIRISKYVYMRNIVPKCTAQTEATVLHYYDLPDPFEDYDYIHNTRTLVETDLGNGLQEVELRGMQGKHKGDILILHYNPDNIEQFYTEVKQTAPDAPDEKYSTTGWLIALLLLPLLISFTVTIIIHKEREKESEKQSEGDE